MGSSRRPVFRRGFARKPFESAIELRQRLEADFKRDFADPQIRNAEKFARLLDPRAGNIIDKFGAGHPFEFLAQIIRADGDEGRNFCQGKLLPQMLMDETTRFPDPRRLRVVEDLHPGVWGSSWS